MIIIAGVRHLLKDTSLPYTVILIVLGMLLGGLPSWSPMAFTNDYLQIARLDPHLMLIIFLPTLIFESAFALDVHTFKKMIGQTIVLAGPGLLVSSFLLSILSRFIFPYGWSWVVSMLFGTVLSATDPVAIVALLKDLGQSFTCNMYCSIVPILQELPSNWVQSLKESHSSMMERLLCYIMY